VRRLAAGLWPKRVDSPRRMSSQLSRFNRGVFSSRTFEARESRLRKALAMFEGEPRRGRLLDVAAGSGIAAEALTDQGWEVAATDISDELVAQIRARGVDARVHDLASGPLPFEDASFEAVFAGEIIEHLVDTTAFLDDVRRVLTPGGIVVITTPNLASLENRLRLLLGRYPIWVEFALSDQGHVRAYTLPTLRAHLQARGFVIESVAGNWVPLLPQRWIDDIRLPPLARTGDWFPALSQVLIVMARRYPESA
jgi:2-polyprenyl-3-methyl-5-hydroxy-6-metoxy-1,4-benzoquinol methylase